MNIIYIRGETWGRLKDIVKFPLQLFDLNLDIFLLSLNSQSKLVKIGIFMCDARQIKTGKNKEIIWDEKRALQ